MASWFKSKRRGDGGRPEDPADSTIEVKAHVIDDAVRAGQAVEPSGIAADGLIGGVRARAAEDTVSSRDDDWENQVDQVDQVDVALLDQALAERRSLVQLCLYALDRAKSSGVAERIEEGLAGVGVAAVRPDGDRFDPAKHEAGGTVATGDESLDGTVAETEVVGFSDRGQVLRVPIVTVYTSNKATP